MAEGLTTHRRTVGEATRNGNARAHEIGGIESRTSKKTWRYPTALDAAYFTPLAAWATASATSSRSSPPLRPTGKPHYCYYCRCYLHPRSPGVTPVGPRRRPVPQSTALRAAAVPKRHQIPPVGGAWCGRSPPPPMCTAQLSRGWPAHSGDGRARRRTGGGQGRALRARWSSRRCRHSMDRYAARFFAVKPSALRAFTAKQQREREHRHGQPSTHL